MTEQEKINYNKMFNILLKISSQYQTPGEIKDNSEETFGLDFEEALEMSYDNIQLEAIMAIHGLNVIK